MLSNKIHIALIVDDEEQICKLLSILLRIEKIDSVCAFDVKTANEFIRSDKHIDLILVDYFLPDGDGSQVINTAKSLRPNTPIIVMSGKSQEIKLDSLVTGANIVLQKPFSEVEFLMIVRNLISLAEANEKLKDAEKIIEVLGLALEARDSYTEGHGKRVAQLSIDLYDNLGMNDRQERHDLYIGSILHDVGKIGVPDSILKSPTKLTTEEFELVKRHTQIGYDICKNLGIKDSLEIILYHHEKLDGSGYPKNLAKGQIPFLVQLVTISDIYDSMVSKRTYREALSSKEALKEMQKEVKSGKLNKEFFEVFKEQILKVK